MTRVIEPDLKNRTQGKREARTGSLTIFALLNDYCIRGGVSNSYIWAQIFMAYGLWFTCVYAVTFTRHCRSDFAWKQLLVWELRQSNYYFLFSLLPLSVESIAGVHYQGIIVF